MDVFCRMVMIIIEKIIIEKIPARASGAAPPPGQR
jgi:hypothetical protein